MDVGEHRLDFGFGETACLVSGDGVLQLFGPEFHIVKIGNGLAERVGNVRQLGFEAAEGLAGKFRIDRIHRIVGKGVGNKDGHTPIGAVDAAPGLAGTILERDKTKHFALDVALAGGFQFGADVAGHRLDIALKHFHILENSVVDALQDIVGGSGGGRYFIGVVDESVSEGFDAFDASFKRETRENVGGVCAHCRSKITSILQKYAQVGRKTNFFATFAVRIGVLAQLVER